MPLENFNSNGPEETFAFGERLAVELRGGDVVLLHGGLGAGKTLLTKGIAHGLGLDVDEVTSPSFALVNLYKTPEHNIYHIDLWRIDDGGDAAFAVGLDEILDDPKAIVMIEWAERLGGKRLDARVFDISLVGDGDEPRKITVTRPEQMIPNFV